MDNNTFQPDESGSFCGINDEIVTTAQKAFGITYLYPWQRLVIENILDAVYLTRKDEQKSAEIKKPQSEISANNEAENEEPEERGRQIVLLPTGAGKSLCFMVPALLLKGCTLIFYPLLALMADQERRMIEGGMKPVVFRGAQSREEREENFNKIKNGAKFILANPEVLQSQPLLERLASCNIEHIAIDEAHCVSEWGDSFRPAYLELGKIIEKLGVKTVTAFTATASPEVLERMADILFVGKAHLVRSDSDRPNIQYAVSYGYAKEKLLLECLSQSQRPLIVFCATRRRAEESSRLIRAFLQLKGQKSDDTVRFYHAGLNREEKTLCEKWFYAKTDAILTATCAFGMGVDKKDIRTVIHLDPPPTAEAYIQEAGRGGRDGSIARAVLLWSPEDEKKAADFPQGSRLRVLSDFAMAKSCRRQILLDALGGEQAACSGCDICDGTADFLYHDAENALVLLKKMRNKNSKSEFENELRQHLNKDALEKYGVQFWEEQDVRNITRILLEQKQLRLHRDIFRQNTIDFGKALAEKKISLRRRSPE